MNKNKDSFHTPILFLIFNRLNNAQQVFNEIKKIKPSKLFVAADGPRETVEEDLQKCLETRKILEKIDWDCQVQTLFQDKNLGCGLAVSTAIDWFFENVDEGIILEDDCVPDETFFYFVSDLLEKYRFNNQIMMISGTSYFFNKIEYPEDYYFSKFYAIWGWATWKRAWSRYDFYMKNWKAQRGPNIDHLKKFFNNNVIVDFWINNFDQVAMNKIDTWDYQWCYACIMNNSFAISPINNIVLNVGDVGVHFKSGSPFLRMPIKKIDCNNLKHPNDARENLFLDKICYKNIGVKKTLTLKANIRNVLSKVYRLFFC